MAKWKFGLGIQQKLESLSRIERNGIARLMKTELEPLKEEAEFLTPVRSGLMEESYKIKTISRKNWLGADLIIDTQTVWYGRFVEWGTVNQEPQEPMRNASENEGPAVTKSIGEKIRSKIINILQ